MQLPSNDFVNTRQFIHGSDSEMHVDSVIKNILANLHYHILDS